MTAYDPTEPVSILRAIPIIENHEPLVDFSVAYPDLRIDQPRFRYRRAPYLRQGILERLVAADLTLRESGYRLLILEGWRSPVIQQRMFRLAEVKLRERYPDLSETELRDMVETFTAPQSDVVPPPHSTGGAVDLSLGTLDGQPLDMISPFDPYDPAGFATDAEGLTPTARNHRNILAAALSSQGVTNYVSEFWHWSYGDQGWAYRGHHPHALYGPTAPIGWVTDHADGIDAPLEFLAGP